MFFSRARAGDIKNGYEICSLDTTCSHVAVAWWIDRLLLSMICVGSIPGVINFFLCEKGSKVLDLIIFRGEGGRVEITVTKLAKFDELENLSLVGHTYSAISWPTKSRD